MKFIHHMNSLPRLVSGALADRLAVMPAVVVTLDDFDVLDAARRDPEALVGGHRSEPQSWSLPANRFGEPARHGWRCVLAVPWWRVL